ncbi:hypothetical protein ACHAP5_005584 [Fusarium lateritium]
MAAQFMYEDAKQKWLEAIKDAQSKKDDAEASYESEKNDGLTDASFVDWAPNNRPDFMAAHQNYKAAEAQYEAAFQNLDSSAYQEWQNKKGRTLAPLMATTDDWQFYIYTGEE